jgi:N-acetylglutamate synthase-like GNAT family acetyltransferase
MKASLRRATLADEDVIRRLVHEAYSLYVPRIGCEPAPMTADYAALITAETVTVAQIDGDLVGVLVTHPHAAYLLVENVAVAPPHQGRGLGRLLLQHAETQARDLGLPELRLYTNQAMVENLAMYPRLGYVEVSRNVEDGFARVHFRKPVAPGRT